MDSTARRLRLLFGVVACQLTAFPMKWGAVNDLERVRFYVNNVMRCAVKINGFSMAAMISAMLLICVAAFCGFGFLASFEPVVNALWWKIGYAGVGVTSLVSAVWLFARALRQTGLS